MEAPRKTRLYTTPPPPTRTKMGTEDRQAEHEKKKNGPEKAATTRAGRSSKTCKASVAEQQYHEQRECPWYTYLPCSNINYLDSEFTLAFVFGSIATSKD